MYQDSAGVKNFYYIHTDYLGSWLSVTDNTGSLKNRYSYDAWGRPRSPSTWALMPIGISDALINNLNAMQPRFDRGYTGHEQMAGFGLINMNGRLYDPYLQRFLSPDKYVQDATNAQSYNRYSYCLNSPLMYTDPSGWISMSLSEFIKQAMSSGSFGGYWENDGRGGGSGTIYTTEKEAAEGAVNYNDFHDSWENTEFKHGATVCIIKEKHVWPGIGNYYTYKYSLTPKLELKNNFTYPSSGGVYDWGRAGNAIGAADVAYDVLENAVANKYWWMDAKGNYNSTKILSKGANGKFIQGVQGYRSGYNSALNAASKFRVAGNIVGGLGIGVTLVQLGTNQITGFEVSCDATFGVISFMGPIGAGIGATYFIGKLGYEYISGNTLFEKPQ